MCVDVRSKGSSIVTDECELNHAHNSWADRTFGGAPGAVHSRAHHAVSEPAVGVLPTRSLTVLACTLALACGGAEPTPTVPDAGPTLDAGSQCKLSFEEGAPQGLRVGSHARIQLLTEGVGDIQVQAPEGWRVELNEAGLDLVVGYTVQTATVSVSTVCANGQVVQSDLPLAVQPLSFSLAAQWTGGDDGPKAREYFSMWVDPEDAERLWVFGGFHYRPRQFTPAQDIWSMDLKTHAWTQHAPGPADALPGAGLAVSPEGYALRYGGLNFNQIPGVSQMPFQLLKARTSSAGLQFEAVAPSDAPAGGDYQPSFFYHPPSEAFYGACGANDFGARCDVVRYDPASNAWENVLTEGLEPPSRNGHFWAYDDSTDRLIVFSGEGSPASSACDLCRHDTWALEMSETPPRWVKLADDGGALGAIGRRNGTYALDPVHHRLLVWGGTSDGRTPREGLLALDLDRGHERWVEVPTEGDAPARASGGMVFDQQRQRMLVGFGNGARVYTDLWALELGTP